MERNYQYVKKSVVSFKLDYCCWLAPLRVGIFIIAYLNILVTIITLIGTANESFLPLIMKVQEVIMEDYVTKPIPILAYCTELGFNVLLLCAMYRKDIVLVRVFMYYNITTIIASTLVYSMVIPAVDVLLTLTIIFSILFQIYMLILVRSAIVEFKEEREIQNGKVPPEVLFSSLKKEREDTEQDKSEGENEISTSDSEPVHEEPKKDEDHKKERDRLETVEEHPNEIRIELKP